MSIQGSLNIFSPLDLLQNLTDKIGVLCLTTPSDTVHMSISHGCLYRLLWQHREQPLDFAPLVLLELCVARQGSFKFVPRFPGIADARPLGSITPMRLYALLWTLVQAQMQLEEGLKLPSPHERFIVWKPVLALREWESALWSAVSPLLLQGYSVQEIAEQLQLPLEGVRYGLCCLQQAGAIETLTPTLEMNWMPNLVQVA